MWSALVSDVQSQDVIFLGLLALGLFMLYVSFFSKERLMGLAGSVLGMVVWWALGGYWLNMLTDFPDIAFIFFACGMVCFLILVYGVWGYFFDKKGILIGPGTE